MQALYHDAMAISRVIGQPDLFITMTCNPKWPEITRFLTDFPPGTTAADVPTFVCRLFYQKCLELIRELDLVFGSIRAYVYTIEFQKRGLPHMHLLVTLNEKLLTADDVDRFVQAEIPNRTEDPELWYKVIKHMCHGPHTSKPSMCWDPATKICSKKFPKQFSDFTDMTAGGFPMYRRRDNVTACHTYHGKKEGKIVNVDNSMVVPYNPYLLRRFNCHINTEYCASVMSIKYIHKYIHKGHDRARVQVSTGASDSDGGAEVLDEIQSYIDARYVSAMESAWYICELPMHGRSHAVHTLPVHLAGQNYVCFREGCEQAAVQRRPNSKLLAYFDLNRDDTNAHQYTYIQIPSHYVWDAKDRRWKPRQAAYRLATRMNMVSPRDVERFHLKLLLQHVRGPMDYEDLKHHDGVTYDSFQACARATGLSKSEDFIVEVLEDAVNVMMPKALRHFYVYLIMMGDVDAPLIWDKFKHKLSEDSNEDTALNIIKELLDKEGQTLNQYGLPEVNMVRVVADTAADEDLSASEHDKLFRAMYEQLNTEQLKAFKRLRQSIDTTGIQSIVEEQLSSAPTSVDNMFFIDGPGGTGKTFLYKCIVHYCKYQNKQVLTVAWTGIAAILLPYGRTAHKTFTLPLNTVDDDSTMLTWNANQKRILQSVDVIIWDEASMIPQPVLSLIDRSLRDVFSSQEPFAGKIVILGGDFRQVLPVVKRGGRRQIFEACLKNSPLWPHIKQLKLSRNMRASGDSLEFSKWLLDIGNHTVKTLQLPNTMLSEDLIDEFYPTDITVEDMSTRAILAARNEEVRSINQSVLKRLPGTEHSCHSIDQACSVGGDETENESAALQYPREYTESLTPSGMPPALLTLKEGCIVMLLRNLFISDGLCNGTRLIVRGIRSNILMCQVLTGDKKGTIVHIPRITIDTRGDLDMPFVLKRLQFPVRLAFAMTINKSQGQTFEKVGLFVTSRDTIFTHGQLYVALSRCTSFSGIRIQCTLDAKVIPNIVFPEALL